MEPNRSKVSMKDGKIRWIVKDGDGRIFGPFETERVLSEIERGFFQGSEQVAVYPGGKWIPISKAPEFYDRLLDVLSAEIEANGPIKKSEPQNDIQAAEKSKSASKPQSPKTGTGQTSGKTQNDIEGQEDSISINAYSASIGTPTLSLAEHTSTEAQEGEFTRSRMTSPSVIELTDLEALEKLERRRKLKRPLLAVIVAAAVLALVMSYDLISDSVSPNRIRLLQMRLKASPINNADAKEKFLKALKAFEMDTFEGYQRAQNELVEVGEASFRRPEDSRERASVMQLLCLTYRELWPYSYQDSGDSKAVQLAVREAKRLDPGGIHGSVCEIVDLLVTTRMNEAQNKADNTLEEEGQAPVAFEMRGELYYINKEYSNAANYFNQARVLYPNWMKNWVQEARAKAMLDQVNESIQLYKHVLEKSPGHIVARVEYGILHFTKVNQPDRAFDIIGAALDSGARMPRQVEAKANYYLAEILIKRGQTSKARQYASAALKLSPGERRFKELVESLGGDTSRRTTREDSRELVFVGDQLAKGGDCFSAQAQYKTAFEADPKNGMAAVKAARCLWKLNQVNDSIKWLQAAIKAEPQLTAAYTELADYYAQRYDFQAATQVIRKVQASQPNNHEVWRGMAIVELRRNNFKAAVAYAQRALKIYESDVDSLVVMAKAQKGLRNFPEANSFAQRAIELDFNNVEAQSLMGKIKVGLLGVDVAAEYMRALIAKYFIKQGQPVPFAAIEYRIALGEVYIEDERYQQAEELFRQAIQLDPNNKRALVNLGNTLKIMGQGTAALEALLKAAVLDPSDPEPIYLLGQVYLDKGQVVEAIKQFERVLKVNDKFPRARISLGRAALRSGDADRGLREAQEERLHNPEMADAYVLGAEAYYALGQYGNCGAEYQKAVAKGMLTSDVLIRAARCFRLAGSLESAVSLLRQAQTIESGHAEIYLEQGAVFQTNGLVEESIKAYEIYLRLSPNAKEKAEIERRIQRIQSGDISLHDK